MALEFRLPQQEESQRLEAELHIVEGNLELHLNGYCVAFISAKDGVLVTTVMSRGVAGLKTDADGRIVIEKGL